jgi:hypothetical protein
MNHLIRWEQEAWGDGQAEHLGSCEIEDQLELHGAFQQLFYHSFMTVDEFLDMLYTVQAAHDARNARYPLWDSGSLWNT